MTTAQPPNKRNAPVKAHDKSDLISLGVISLKHSFGFVPNGIINAICWKSAHALLPYKEPSRTSIQQIPRVKQMLR